MRAARWLLSLTLMLAAGCGGGGGDGDASRLLSLGTDLLATDLDGDGRAEIVTLGHLYGDQPNKGRLVVHRASATGAWRVVQTLEVGCYPWTVQAVDIDGDGLKDLVVTDVGNRGCVDPTPGDGLYLLLQDRAAPATFGTAQRLPASFAASTVAVADFTGDGHPDIAYGHRRNGVELLVVLPQDAARPGRFGAPIERVMAGSVYTIATGDLDGDGRADLLFHLYDPDATRPSRSSLGLLQQLPGGGFGALQTLAPQTGLNVRQLAITDLDANGRADLLVHYTASSTDYLGKLTVLLQGASATDWSAPIDTGLGEVDGDSGTAFGDLDRDGRPDVALAGTYPTGSPPLGPPDFSAQVNVMLRSGGGFRHALRAGLPIDADTVAIGDVDGDGVNDLVVADGDGLVHWMRQRPTRPGTFSPSAALP